MAGCNYSMVVLVLTVPSGRRYADNMFVLKTCVTMPGYCVSPAVIFKIMEG